MFTKEPTQKFQRITLTIEIDTRRRLIPIEFHFHSYVYEWRLEKNILQIRSAASKPVEAYVK